jgi:hypothetical protein
MAKTYAPSLGRIFADSTDTSCALALARVNLIANWKSVRHVSTYGKRLRSASPNAARIVIAIDDDSDRVNRPSDLVRRGIPVRSDASNTMSEGRQQELHQSSGNDLAPDPDQLKFNMNGEVS